MRSGQEPERMGGVRSEVLRTPVYQGGDANGSWRRTLQPLEGTEVVATLEAPESILV